MPDPRTSLLDTVGAADELEITTLRWDGSPRAWVPIWVVRVGDRLYVRSYRGGRGGWYRHATASGHARIRAGRITREVAIHPLDQTAQAQLTQAIDHAYQTKYARYPSFLPPMLSGQARATTLRLDPTPEPDGEPAASTDPHPTRQRH